MVALSHLAMALAAIAPALAAPKAETPVQKRGPHNFVLGPDHPLMLARRNLTMSRRSTNYDQDYTTGGTVDFSPASGEFYVAWDTTDDFVVGVGWNPGSTLYGTNPPSLLLLFFPSA
jgi:endo-1,4-beta-xylanase